MHRTFRVIFKFAMMLRSLHTSRSILLATMETDALFFLGTCWHLELAETEPSEETQEQLAVPAPGSHTARPLPLIPGASTPQELVSS